MSIQAIEAEKFQGVIFHCFCQYICIHGDYFRSCTTLSLNYNTVLFGKKKLMWFNFVDERGRTTNGEIGPVTDQIYETWNFTIFVIWIIRGKSKLCIYTKHSLITIDLLEQLAGAFVQFSDLAKNWHFCTPINVNISKPPPLDPKIVDIQRIFLKRSKRVWLLKLDRRLGRMWIMKK